MYAFPVNACEDPGADGAGILGRVFCCIPSPADCRFIVVPPEGGYGPREFGWM
jgi:hypothetical protein